MKSFLSFFLVFFLWAAPSAQAAEPATRDDIYMLLEVIKRNQEQVEKRFEQIDDRFEQVDRRFEQVDKRFEQVDKRFEFIQSLIIALLVVTIGTPFAVDAYRRRRDDSDKQLLRGFDRLLVAMREAANHDPKLKEILKSARLL